ncbi:hypothetical protein [Chitinophaga filiformis]|uniref:Uncharacterized protein n=1 Tax=Chitinophaga filiformis TaxID=104663 RepID=A0A1G7UP97_CHIFI|nr:hypothetical protein [Chitinophaga filiformis]SDG48939.1 hypothetical protein SAMN04488121_104444 [Chitinophaga filiformis]
MKRVSVKNLSLLGLVLMAASAVTAAVMPDKSNNKRVNNGTLRAFSNGDSVNEDVISCVIVSGGGVNSCTVSGTATTAAGAQIDESRVQIGSLFYQTVGNTSQTGGPANGNQSSVLAVA